MRNWDLIGWAGMHEFISMRVFFCWDDADNYEGLWFNERKEKKEKKVVHMLVYL